MYQWRESTQRTRTVGGCTVTAMDSGDRHVYACATHHQDLGRHVVVATVSLLVADDAAADVVAAPLHASARRAAADAAQRIGEDAP